MTNFINEKELKDKFVPGQVYDYGSIMRKIETTSWRGRVRVEADDFCKWGEPV